MVVKCHHFALTPKSLYLVALRYNKGTNFNETKCNYKKKG